VGSLKEALRKFTQITEVLPALGYYDAQLRELEQTIAAVPCDSVVIGTPIDLRRVIRIAQPATRARYELREHDQAALKAAVATAIGR
jgi:predicted GTPase